MGRELTQITFGQLKTKKEIKIKLKLIVFERGMA